MEIKTESQKHIIVQWFKRHHWESMQRCAKFRPDLNVSLRVKSQDDQMVYGQLTFTSIGRNLYHQRLVHFIITSLDEYQTTT
jgi:hypothetical protein